MTLIAAGGDLRQKAAAEALSGEYDVYLTGFGRTADTALPESAEVLLLPTPAAPDGRYLFAPFADQPLALDELLGRLSPGAAVLGGRMTAELCETVEAAGFSAIDYTQSDSFAERNAIPTAEGALMLAMQALPVTLHGLSCLILGAGRISRALQMRLSGLGAHVTVAARRFPDLARTEGGKQKHAAGRGAPCLQANGAFWLREPFGIFSQVA
jgi:dipicolinate synthase subunit A